jgi:hypothetical protein
MIAINQSINSSISLIDSRTPIGIDLYPVRWPLAVPLSQGWAAAQSISGPFDRSQANPTLCFSLYYPWTSSHRSCAAEHRCQQPMSRH